MTITWDIIVSIAAGVTAICVAIGWIYKIVKKAASPMEKNEERITAIETRLAEHDRQFAENDRRLKDVENESIVIMKALLALLSHGIDGDALDSMRMARDELQKYLIER